jgi:type II secretory pathway component PulK
MRSRRGEAGVVLVVVLVFALLLASSVATFLRRATVDTLIARNRESAARAESIARGGIRLATVLILEDKLRGDGAATGTDLWAQVGLVDIPVDELSSLRLQILDAGDKLNLNAVFQFDDSGQPNANAIPYLEAILGKVIEELPIDPGEKALYDVPELAANLVDWVDADDLRVRGGAEDDAYQKRDPPRRAANRPLLSLDELRIVEGFGPLLVDALRPYLTVFPYAGRNGINPNTAPPHVLALLYYNDGSELRLAPEDRIREILRVRHEGGSICAEGAETDPQSEIPCTPIGEIVGPNEIYPPPAWSSDVFTARARATVAGVSRTVEAVLDRKQSGEPLLLSWRVL